LVILPQFALTGLRVTSLFELAKPSIYYRKGQRYAHTKSNFFVRFTVSATQISVTQISLSERLRTLSGDRAAGYGLCFLFELCISSYDGRSNGVPFSGVFVRLTVLPLQGSEVTYPIFEISMTFRTRLPAAFHRLVPNDNFHCLLKRQI